MTTKEKYQELFMLAHDSFGHVIFNTPIIYNDIKITSFNISEGGELWYDYTNDKGRKCCSNMYVYNFDKGTRRLNVKLIGTIYKECIK